MLSQHNCLALSLNLSIGFLLYFHPVKVLSLKRRASVI